MNPTHFSEAIRIKFNKTILAYLGGFTLLVAAIIWYFSTISQEQVTVISSVAGNLILFGIIGLYQSVPASFWTMPILIGAAFLLVVLIVVAGRMSGRKPSPAAEKEITD